MQKYDQLLRTNISKEMYAEIQGLVRQGYAKNASELARRFILEGIERAKEHGDSAVQTSAAGSAVGADLEERLAKVNSKGTKASLATLTLSAYTLTAICDILKSIDKDNHAILRALGLTADTDSDIAFARIDDLLTKHPAQVFNWCWDAGGRLQAQKGTPDVAKAVNGLGFRYNEEG